METKYNIIEKAQGQADILGDMAGKLFRLNPDLVPEI